MSEDDVLLRDRKLKIGIVADTVSIHIPCGDAYTARVLFEDILDRLNKGERISIYGYKK